MSLSDEEKDAIVKSLMVYSESVSKIETQSIK